MKRHRIYLLVLIVVLSSVPAWALMIRYDLDKLCVGSSKIVVGEVVEMESCYLIPGHEIHTFVRIDVQKFIKGESSDNHLVLQVPGGTVGEETASVEHAPVFEIGEEVLVFVYRQGDEQEVVYNWENGKYTIEDGVVVEKDVPLDNFIMVIQALLNGDRHPEQQGD